MHCHDIAVRVVMADQHAFLTAYKRPLVRNSLKMSDPGCPQKYADLLPLKARAALAACTWYQAGQQACFSDARLCC